MTLHTCHDHLKTYIYSRILEKYIAERLRVVLKLLEYIVVLHTLLYASRNYHIILTINK